MDLDCIDWFLTQTGQTIKCQLMVSKCINNRNKRSYHKREVTVLWESDCREEGGGGRKNRSFFDSFDKTITNLGFLLFVSSLA